MNHLIASFILSLACAGRNAYWGGRNLRLGYGLVLAEPLAYKLFPIGPVATHTLSPREGYAAAGLSVRYVRVGSSDEYNAVFGFAAAPAIAEHRAGNHLVAGPALVFGFEDLGLTHDINVGGPTGSINTLEVLRSTLAYGNGHS